MELTAMEQKNKEETLYSFLSTKEHGYSLSWKEIRGLIDGDKLSKPVLYHIVKRVNDRMMTEDQKYLETIYNFGKRIILPNEHRKESRKSVKSAVKKYQKAGMVLAATNMDLLTSAERKKVENDAMKWRTLELISTELVRKKEISKRTDINKNLVSDVIKLFSKEEEK